jgi:DNA-binding transcriptional ArsR family regulator
MSPLDNLAAPDFEALVELFKALAHESRLRLVGLLSERPRTVEELAAALGLSASTVSHHLLKLKEAGLVDAARDQYYQVYRFTPERMQEVVKLLLQRPAAVVPASTGPSPEEEERFRQEVLSNFMVDGKLVKIPAQRKKREVVLRFLAEQFEPGRTYTEKEVNAVIGRYHEDYCTLRRELVMNAHRLMTREAGLYKRA